MHAASDAEQATDDSGGAPVELLRFGRVEGQAEQDEGVGKALNPEANRPVPHVALARTLDGIVVDVDDLIQVARDDGRHLGELVEVEHPVLRVERA